MGVKLVAEHTDISDTPTIKRSAMGMAFAEVLDTIPASHVLVDCETRELLH